MNEQWLECEGWWEQEGYGRQLMTDLRLAFQEGLIKGEGVDVIGPFLFLGKLTEEGQVSLIKQYLGQHSVDYLGQYDGEGELAGIWQIDGFHGRWSIRIKRAPQSDDTIIEFVPPTTP